MKNERKRNDCQFKPPVALEALKGLKTVQQIAKEFGIHPGQVSDWKKQLSEQAGSVFENGNNREVEGFDKEREGLHSKIGELIVQFDFAVNRYCLNTLLVPGLTHQNRGKWGGRFRRGRLGRGRNACVCCARSLSAHWL